jgi:hypothetical protein
MSERAFLVELGEPEKIVHQGAHPYRLLLDGAHRGGQILGPVPDSEIEQLGIPEDRCEGSTELV